MLSNKPWLPESVLLFCGAQFLCFFAGLCAVTLLHQAGVHGFRREESFGSILAVTLSFQGATWLLIPLLLRWNEIHWRDFFGLRNGNLLRGLAWMTTVLIAELMFEYVYELVLQ